MVPRSSGWRCRGQGRRGGLDRTQRRERARDLRQCGARDAAVLVHAPYQILDGFEFQLRPDPLEEGDVDRLSIKVAGKIEQEYFEQHRADVEHRAAAEAGDAIVSAP